MKEAIVLAGGFGTRLAHIIPDIPKPMAPVCGRPFLRYILDNLQVKGVERVILSTGYKQACIKEFFGVCYRGMEVVYSSEDIPLGTGGAIKQALSLCRQEWVAVVNGDTYFNVDFTTMEAIKRPGAVILASKRMQDFDRYGALEIEGKRVVAFREKSYCTDGLINGGVYLMERTLLESVSEKRFSFETAILEPLVAREDVLTVESNGYFIDIGVPEDYAAAQRTLKSLAPVNRAAFFQRDGIINKYIYFLERPEDLQFLDGMSGFIKKWNDWGYKVIFVTNQASIAREYYTPDEMRTIYSYMNERLAKTGAHIDAFYCRSHHPDITDSCRKSDGLIEHAIRDFDLDPTRCIFFGDQTFDVEEGQRCGIFSVFCNRAMCDLETVE